MANVYLGVKAQGASAAEAQKTNTELTASFLKAIKNAGVADNDIVTANINVYQDYEDNTKYYAETSYKVTIKNISRVGEIIDTAINAGANNSYSLSFDVSNREELYLKALGLAIKGVQQKAKTVAEAGGYKLLGTKSIEESGTSSLYRDNGVLEMAANDAAPAKAMAIEPGDIEISAAVTGIFNIE